MLNDFRLDLSVFLNLFLGPQAFRLPSVSSPKRSCLPSFIRATWPAYLSWVCIRNVEMLGRPAFSNTSVSGILSCHLIPSILRRQTV